jgi:hypothetical protein
VPQTAYDPVTLRNLIAAGINPKLLFQYRDGIYANVTLGAELFPQATVQPPPSSAAPPRTGATAKPATSPPSRGGRCAPGRVGGGDDCCCCI